MRALIEYPWRSFGCGANESDCTVEFDDPDFGKKSCEYFYYVRAIEKPSATVNAGGLRCEFNDQGECAKVGRYVSGFQATDLDAYVTERALSGLFTTLADEEKKIRENPAARTSELLKKVFGRY